MDNNKKIKNINKKLILLLVILLAILGTLLTTKANALNVPAEIESTKQSDRGNPTWLTYNDLVGFYDILCCQHGTPLKGAGSVILEGSYGSTSFSESLGNLTSKDKGTKKYSHTIYYQGSDFSSSTYTHFTYGYYSIVEQHIATPKEAYIIAEMKKELETNNGESSYEIHVDANGNKKKYTGGLYEADSLQLSTGETAYIINQTYVLDNGQGKYLVERAHDSDGNVYYVYKTDATGQLITYGGNLSYVDDKSGVVVDYHGAHVEAVYYKFNGTISEPGSKYPGEGTLYLVDYDTVVDLSGTLYVCTLRGDYNYIQIAWWTTDMGTSHGTLAPSVPNGLAKEAEAFEAYILKITGTKNVSSLNYQKQSYEFTDENGKKVSGQIEAPVIDYNPKWNEDADQNGSINETDEVTVAFDGESQKYVVGPFSIDYVKKSIQVQGRNKVDFSGISGVKLVSNLGELELGKDWNFKWLTDQARDLEEGYEYPNPNEVFYIEINYKVGMTSIKEFTFDFKYMNAGARLDIYDGKYNKVTWTVKSDDTYVPVDTDDDGVNDDYKFSYRKIWLELTSLEPFDSQTLAHGLLGARWYSYKTITREWEVPHYAYITVEKETVDADGNIVPIDQNFDFEIYVNGELFQTLSVETTNGYGTKTSEKITWEDGDAPTYKVVEVNYDSERYTPQGPWEGTLPNCDTITIEAQNIVEPYKGTLEIDKKLLNPTPAMEGEEFEFEVTITGNFKYNKETYNATSSDPLVLNVKLSSATNWTWKSNEFTWYEDAPHYKVKEIIPNGAGFELVGEINQGIGYLENDQNKVAIATNKPTTNSGTVMLNKTFVSSTQALEHEVFTIEVTIKGKFSYNGDELQERELNLTATLDVNNNWTWESAVIEWNENEVPEVAAKEVNIPAIAEFVSVSDGNKTLLENTYSGKLQGETTIITYTNKEVDYETGKITVNKKAETEDIIGKTFNFTVKVEGTFKYGNDDTTATQYTNSYLEIPVTVTANGDSWVSEEIKWVKGQDAPKYTVKENSIPEDIEFISISNGKQTITSTPEISDTLSSEDPIIITAINRGKSDPGTHIQITKEVEDDSLKGLEFKFKVTINGSFRYTDESGNTKQYTNEELEINDAIAIAGGTDWVSGYIEWDVGGKAPKYTVEEIEVPENVEVVSLSNRLETVTTKSISGTLTEGTIVNVTAINKLKEEEKSGSIKIVKKSLNESLSGETFYFKVKITGDFKYGNDSSTAQSYTTLELDATAIADGDGWESETITWMGDKAPTYTVTEDESKLPEYVKVVSLANDTQTNTSNTITGSVVEGEVPVTVTAINKKEEPKTLKGRLQIKKTYVDDNGNEIVGKKFYFKVTVGDQTFDVTVESGSTWRSGYFYWLENEEAPAYSIEETNSGECKVDIDNSEGRLEAQDLENGIQGVTFVNVKNTITSKKSQIQINKDLIIQDKLNPNDATGTFTFEVKVTGTFTYNNVSYVDDTMSIQVTISEKNNWTWTSKAIYWYEEAPTYAVEETDLPANWSLVSMKNSSGVLENGKVSVVDCTNEWKPIEEIILTMEIGGKVWDDTDRTMDKHVDAQENGIIDEGEAGIENVKVNVYRVVTDGNGKTLARLQDVYAYDENNLSVRVDATTYTDSNGNWKIEAISVPAYKDESEKESLKAKYGNNIQLGYDVEFEYDGQTYEPTTYLATAAKELGESSTAEQRASSYRSKSTSERDNYLYDSMTIDDVNERIEFNNSFENITGEEPMDDRGNTLGLAEGNGGSKELHYSSVDSVSLFNSDNSRKVSTLETTDENGNVYEDLLMKARTSTAGLTYPFDNKIHLTHWDKELTDIFKVTYYYSATYNYCLSINLGLIEREAADSAVEKDLDTATVVVNGKVLKYKYNRAIDLDNPDNTELLYKQIAVADEQIEYKLGLYSSDYYYRAAVYNGTEAGDALDGFYTQKLNLPKETTEMEIYLTYRIIVHNESETFNLRINTLADYYDSSFELITDNSAYEKTHRYVQTVNGKQVDSVIQLAEGSKVTYYTSGIQENGTASVVWTDSKEVNGSDDVTYTKMTTNSLSNRILASGETAEITMTFRIEKDNFDEAGVYNTIKLGDKHNVAEVASFTSFYSDESKNKWSKPGQITGRVDEDSAPNNVNIENYNEKTYYEDDTDAAPIITIYLNEEDRAISGIVWDDAQTDTIEYSQTVGNGLYNPSEGDKTIAGLTTEVIEAISIPTDSKDADGNTVYKEYEFAWPTDTPITELGGKTIKELTGFDQSIITNANGEYAFTAVPAGNYRVRFVYGDKDVITGNSGYEEVYNGQDYKSTAYQTGFNNDSDNDGYVDNEWHDLSNKELTSTRVSDSRDNEARRLYVAAKSEILTYANTSILDTADTASTDHTKLYGNYHDATDKVTGEGYYMYTETAKINLAIENVYKIAYTTETIGGVDVGLIDGDITQGATQTGTKDFSYVVENIDCGIEERSPTKLNLDKQIKEIKLITSDNVLILDAIYDINYEIKDNGTITPTVTLNESLSTGIDHIASLNRNGASQGYRYIMAEGTVLQGTTIEIKYQLTVFNISETDRCAQILETLWQDVNMATSETEVNELLDSALQKLSSPYYTEAKGRVYSDGSSYVKSQFGTYFGSIYYLGKQGVGTRTDEIVVKTKVREMIDYVDTDVDFAITDNVARDQSWANITIERLLAEGLIDPAVIQIINSNGELTGDTRADREAGSGERYSIINRYYQEYIVDSKNNVITNIDSGVEGAESTNPALVKDTVPYSANKNYDESTASIALVVSRFFSSESDANDIDNLAEIIKVENTVGRRDFRAVAGNTSPYTLDETGNPIPEYEIAAKEPDTSATEVITLSPPTGLDATESRTIQLILVVLVATVIVAVGIVVIKKKVLVKN